MIIRNNLKKEQLRKHEGKDIIEGVYNHIVVR